MSSEKPKGKRRGRKPKEANDPGSEFPGMFVLPPNILQKLGINFNIGDIQDAQTSASPVIPDKELQKPCLQPKKTGEVDREIEDSSILETANLMKSSVFLSPTFIHPISNSNNINEVEFLSLNPDKTNDVIAAEDQVPEEPQKLSTPKKRNNNNTAKNTQEGVGAKTRNKRKNRDYDVTVGPEYNQDAAKSVAALEKQISADPPKSYTPDKRLRNRAVKDTQHPIETKTRKKEKSKRDETATVAPEYDQLHLAIHEEMIENIRKNIQRTIESVLANPEEMHLDLQTPEITTLADSVIPTATVADYSIPENIINYVNDHSQIVAADIFSSGNTQSSVAVSSEPAVDTVITESTMTDSNASAKIDEISKKDTNGNNGVGNGDKTTYEKELYTDYLDSKAADKSPDIIEALIELNNAEKLLSDEMDLENIETGNLTNFIVQQGHDEERLRIPSAKVNELINVFDIQSNQELNDISAHIFANLQGNNYRDFFSTSESPQAMPQKNSGSSLQILKSKVNINVIESERPVLIAAEANMLIDDHLDEAYLSDCSSSNLGPIGNTGSIQELMEPLSKQEPCSEVKNTKISILSEEVVEPSRFNNILQKAKKFHQKDNLIPVSINTVVSLGHKINSPEYTKINPNYQEISSENSTETMYFEESNIVDNNPIVVEFIDEYEQGEQKIPESVMNQPFVNSDTASNTNIFLQPSNEKANETEPSLSSPLRSLDQIHDAANLSSNELVDNANPAIETNATVEVSEEGATENTYSSLPSQSKTQVPEITDEAGSSTSVPENHKDHTDGEPMSEVKEIASYLSKFAHILANRKKNVTKENRRKTRNIKKSTIKSSFSKEGVEKPGGVDENREFQEDECQSHKIWRTYKISQKLPHIPNNNFDFCKALNVMAEDKIMVQNSTALDDIEIDYDLCEDFGSLCYYETTEDLYEHFKSKDVKITIEELFHEVINCTDAIYSAEADLDDACCSTTEKEVVDDFLHNADSELVKAELNHRPLHEYPEVEDQNMSIQVVSQDGKLITKNEASENKREFEGMESYVNDLLSSMDIDYLRKHKLISDDDSQTNDVSRHFEFDEEALSKQACVSRPTQSTDGGEHHIEVNISNENSMPLSKRINLPVNGETVPEMSTSLKRTHSMEENATAQHYSETAPSHEKNIKCGVCYRTLPYSAWNDHLSNEHCYIAWKDGETVDLKSNVLLSNLNERLKSYALLRCTFCNTEYRACKKFLSHVKLCLEQYINSEAALGASCKCGVCHVVVESDKWFEHIMTTHHYIAWREGDTPIERKQDVKRHLESVLMLHGSLKCSECGKKYKNVDPFKDHTKTCGKNGSYGLEENVRRQSSASESEMKIGYLQELKRSSEKSSISNRSSSFQSRFDSTEPHKKKSKGRSVRQIIETSKSPPNDEKIVDCNISEQKDKICDTATSKHNPEEEYVTRSRRKSASIETRKCISNTDKLLRTKVPKIEPKILQLDGTKTSENPETTVESTALDVLIKKNRKRSRLISIEVNSTVVSETITPETNIIEHVVTGSEMRRKNSLKSIVKVDKEDKVELDEPDGARVIPSSKRRYTRDKLIHSGDDSEFREPDNSCKADDTPEDLPSKPKSFSKRRSMQEKSANSKDKSELRLPSNTSGAERRSMQKKLGHSKDKSEVRIPSYTSKTADLSEEPSSKPEKTDRRSSRNKRHSAQVKPATSTGKQTEDISSGDRLNCDNESINCSQNIACDLPITIKLEPDVNEDISVECGVCHEKVGLRDWILHSHTNHQYLAWHNKEKVLNLEDETEVLGHLKALILTLGSVTCAKCGLVRKQARKFLTHIRCCGVSAKEELWEPPFENDHKKEEAVTTGEILTCAICSQEVPSSSWKKHASVQHYNIAWPVGGEQIDVRNKWHIDKVLKAYKLAVRVLQCKVCGATRASNLGFYAHILACGKTEEEVDKFKETCEICNQKYLCIYKQQHYAFHDQQEATKLLKLELIEKKKSEKEKKKAAKESMGQPCTKRKAAEKARQFVCENYADIKAEFKHQCPDCDFGTDSKLKWRNHRCGQEGSDVEDSMRDEEAQADAEDEAEDETEDGEEDEGDDEEMEELSDEDQPESGPTKRIRSRRSADSTKPRLVKVPFRVDDTKSYVKRSDKDFCNFHYTSERLFADWVPANYQIIPESLAKQYWPPLQESCKVKEKEEWTTFKTFEAKVNKVTMFFIGALPQCVSWVPPVYNASGDDATDNYLAIACHDGTDTPRLNFNRTYSHKGLLQIWDFGQFDGTLPHVCLCITHELGTVWAMDWCPSGARDPTPASVEDCKPARLGLLAVACSDGSAYILSVPYPTETPSGGSMFHKLKPVAELRFDDRKQFQCTTIKWSSQKGHTTIAAGYSDGTVAFFNLADGSPLGQSEEDGVCILYPYSDERVQSTCISGLDLFPSTDALADTGLSCAASVTGLSMWAGGGVPVAKAHVHVASAGAAFQPHWPSVLCLGEEPLTVVDVDWDGWRGRAGPRQIAASARTGVVASYFPPLLRATVPHRLYRDPVRKRIAAIEMKPLSMKRKKEGPNTELQMKVEPLTYEKAIASYGLEMTLLKNDRVPWPNMDELPPERFPLSEVTAMAFCPHPKYAAKLAVATHAGIVYLFNVFTEGLYSSAKK